MRGVLRRLGFNLRVQRNLAFQLATTFLDKGLTLLLDLAAPRFLSRADLGLFRWGQKLTQSLASFTDFGLTTWLTRETARGREGAGDLYAAALGLKACLTLLFLAAAAGAAALYRREVPPALILLLALAALGQNFVDFFEAVFRGFQRLEFATVLVGAFALLTAGTGSVVLSMGGGLLPFAAVLAGGGAAGAVLGGALVAARFYRTGPAFAAGPFLKILAGTWPIGGAALLSGLYFNADLLILGHWFDFKGEPLGLYSGAKRIVEMTQVAPAFLLAAVFPAVARRQEAGRLEWSSVLLLGGFGLVLTAVFARFPEAVLRVFCGPGFSGAAPAFAAMAPAVPLILVNFALTHWLIARDLTVRYLAACAGLVGVSAAANLALLPRMGLVGAAVSLVFTEAALTAFCLWTLARSARKTGPPTADRHSDFSGGR